MMDVQIARRRAIESTMAVWIARGLNQQQGCRVQLRLDCYTDEKDEDVHINLAVDLLASLCDAHVDRVQAERR
jgi:hypothetical protein